MDNKFNLNELADVKAELSEYLRAIGEIEEPDEPVIEMGDSVEKIPGRNWLFGKKKKEEKKKKEPPAERPKLHYGSFDEAVPYVPTETVKKALEAIDELENRDREFRPYIMTYIDDSGKRKIYRFKEVKEAKEYMKESMTAYRERVSNTDDWREIYIDDGNGAGLYDPTPLDQLNDDETFKTEEEIKGVLNVITKETHGVIYNTETGQIARWDLFDLRTAKIK